MAYSDTCAVPSGAAASIFMAAVSSLSQLQCNIGDTTVYPVEPVIFEEYDFIVIGGGTAGCVVANRLSANPKWTVLLVEAGGDPPYTSEVPGLSLSLHNTEVDWSYQSDGEGDYCLGMVGHKCRWAGGKGLGGSSLLNSMIYLRGNPKDYQRWAKEGNEGWDYHDLTKYFEKSEGLVNDGDVGHLSLKPFNDGELPLLKPLKDAASEIGNRATLDHEILAKPGYFTTLGTILNGTRYSAAKAYLAPVKSRKNLHVLRNAEVLRILFDKKKRAVGVVYEKHGKKHTVRAEKEIIISAGAFSSPQLLMISGIGPKEHLQKFGIYTVANLPVGEYMNGHVQVPAIVASINREFSVPEDHKKLMINKVVSFLMDYKGELAGVGYGKFFGFIASPYSNDSKYPDIQIKFAYFSHGDTETLTLTLSALGYGAEVTTAYISLLQEADLLVLIPSIQHPKSCGRVRLVSNNPRDLPKITPNLFTDPADEYTMFGGITEGMSLLKTCSMKIAARVEPRALLKRCLKNKNWHNFHGGRNIDDTPLMTMNYWRCVLKKMAAPDFLPVGTCRMGPHSHDSVVDSRLRVHTVKGLRVIDPCIMPTISTGDTLGAVVAIAEKGASMVKEDWRH